jgi:hypothetical protein
MGFRLTEDEAWAQLAEAHTGLMTTLRRDGRPITLPVWFVVLDRAIYVRTPVHAKKLTRIRNDPRGYFLVEAGERWVDLTAVTLAVTATIVDDPELVARVTAATDAKYAGFAADPDLLPAAVRAAYGEMAVVRLDPDGRLNSWNNRALVSADPQENA